MPVAIAVGVDPALTLAACLPLPPALDEIRYAGFLRGEPVEMVRCVSSDLLVPAHAELVIEGVIEPGETRPEGRFGNHTGRYDRGEEVPLLRVACITHRTGILTMRPSGIEAVELHRSAAAPSCLQLVDKPLTCRARRV